MNEDFDSTTEQQVVDPAAAETAYDVLPKLQSSVRELSSCDMIVPPSNQTPRNPTRKTFKLATPQMWDPNCTTTAANNMSLIAGQLLNTFEKFNTTPHTRPTGLLNWNLTTNLDKTRVDTYGVVGRLAGFLSCSLSSSLSYLADLWLRNYDQVHFISVIRGE